MSVRATSRRKRERFEAQEKAYGLAMPPALVAKRPKTNTVLKHAQSMTCGNDTRVYFVEISAPQVVEQALLNKVFGGKSAIHVSNLHEANVIVIPDEDMDISTPTEAFLHAWLHGQTVLTQKVVESCGREGMKFVVQRPADKLAVFTTPAFRQKHMRQARRPAEV